jgi:bacillithiol biosynthesis deacetylase BshB1
MRPLLLFTFFLLPFAFSKREASMSTTSEQPSPTVVFVGPHPDDLEIICGGTIAKLVIQGYRVAMIDLTTGEPTPRGSLAIRAAEAEEARQVLGVPVRVNLGLPNRELMDTPANRYVLATAFRRMRPHIVVGTAGRTPAASPDHHQAHLLIEAARFYSQLTKWDDRFDNTPPYRVPHLVYAPFPFDAEVRHWHSTFVIDVSDTFEQKMESVRCFRSQFDGERYERVKHALTGSAIATGTRCGFAYGELFAMPGPLGAQDLVTLVSGAKAATAAPVPLPNQPPPPLEGPLVH